jgi:hypothetical protein
VKIYPGSCEWLKMKNLEELKELANSLDGHNKRVVELVIDGWRLPTYRRELVNEYGCMVYVSQPDVNSNALDDQRSFFYSNGFSIIQNIYLSDWTDEEKLFSINKKITSIYGIDINNTEFLEMIKIVRGPKIVLVSGKEIVQLSDRDIFLYIEGKVVIEVD